MPRRPSRPFTIRRSPIHGRGAFATRPIPAGTRLIEYAGERLTLAQAEARYPHDPTLQGEEQHTFLFLIDDDVVIDATPRGGNRRSRAARSRSGGVAGATTPNDARFINHSCDPNCDAVVDEGRIWIETIRAVKPGEELAYDYQHVLEERHTPAAKRRYPCHCGSPRCRGTMLASKR